MSIRRKLALWLCPELVGSVEARVGYCASAYECARGYPRFAGEMAEAISNVKSSNQEARDADWKAEVLEQLKLLNAAALKVADGSTSMRSVNVNRL